jgi:hypothetical protein
MHHTLKSLKLTPCSSFQKEPRKGDGTFRLADDIPLLPIDSSNCHLSGTGYQVTSWFQVESYYLRIKEELIPRLALLR